MNEIDSPVYYTYWEDENPVKRPGSTRTKLLRGFSHADESAKPGYYQVRLANGVNVELSAIERSGIARFTYPDSLPSKLLIRTSYSQLGSSDAKTYVNIEKQEVVGSVTGGNFCGYLGEYNRRSYYTLHFVIKLDRQITSAGSWQVETVPGMPMFPTNLR